MTDPDRQIWDGMLGHLRRYAAGLCRQWFEELAPVSVDGGALLLRAHSNVHRDYLRNSCSEPFNDAARTVSGRLLAVRFLGPDDPVPVPQRVPTRVRSIVEHKPAPTDDAEAARPISVNEPRHPQPTRTTFSGHFASPHESMGGGRTHMDPHEATIVRREETLIINPDYSFDNFVVGSGNRLANAGAVAVAGNPGRSYNPFFIHGGVGLGKTHLLQAICIQLKEQNPHAVICYLSCEGFLTHFIEAVGSNEMEQFRHRFREVDCLIVDDIHFLAKADRTQEEFFHTFNSLYSASKQIVLSSDEAPEEIPNLEERLVSRFKWGLVAKVEAPDFETRVAILKNKARLRGLPLPDEVAAFIATRIHKNIRELEGAIGKLQLLVAVDNRPIDMEMAVQVVGELPQRPTAEPTIQSIITIVTDFYRVRLVDLQSERRQRSVAQPRQVCMFLIRHLTRHSLEEVGGYFGNRDHTTVMHALRMVESRRLQEPDFDIVIRSLEDRIRDAAL